MDNPNGVMIKLMVITTSDLRPVKCNNSSRPVTASSVVFTSGIICM